jgi:hypothetical protein
MWRSSKSVFFSRSTIAERCTQGQVLKLTSMYFAMATFGWLVEAYMIARPRRGVNRKIESGSPIPLTSP